MLDRATTPLLLSALLFNRQMNRLKANESEQAAQVWKTLCLPLKQFQVQADFYLMKNQ